MNTVVENVRIKLTVIRQWEITSSLIVVVKELEC